MLSFCGSILAAQCLTFVCSVVATSQVTNLLFEKTGVLERGWLLSDLWRLVASYFSSMGNFFFLLFVCVCVVWFWRLITRAADLFLRFSWTEQLAVIPLTISTTLTALYHTPSGYLLCTTLEPCTLQAIDPGSGVSRCLLNSGLASAISMAVSESERCAYVTDFLAHVIFRVTLPPYLFEPSPLVVS